MARKLEIKDPLGHLEPLKTPCLVVSTDMGLIPNVTPDLHSSHISTPLYFSLGDFIENDLPKGMTIPDALGHHQNPNSRWIFLGPASCFFNCFDEGPSLEKGIKIYSRNGNLKTVSKEDYQKVVTAIKPQGIISLYSPVLPGSSSRQKKLRITATNEFSVQYPNAINFFHSSCEKIENDTIGQIFTQFGEISEDDEKEITAKIERQKTDAPRIMMMDGHPIEVRKAYSLGIDLFILQFPFVAAKKGIAMVFDFAIKNTTSSTNNNDENKTDKEKMIVGIDLKAKEYEHDHGKVCEDCDCQCCTQFTRSYLYHLLEVHEMLAGTLLVQHNVRHYQRYLEALREENFSL